MHRDRSRDAPAGALLTLGFAAAVSQAALLREAMAALGGSELAWGAVLGMWLLGMGIGAGLGAHRRSPLGGGASLTMLGLALVGVLLLRAAPAILGVTAGETLGTLQAAWLWPAAVLPAALAGGLGFAGLAAPTSAARAYGLESAGALLGGLLFTFVLAPAGSAAALVIAVGGAAAVLLLGRHARVAAAAVLVAGVVAALAASDTLARRGWRWGGRPGEVAAWRETRQQRLELAAGGPAALYGDGVLLGTFPDSYGALPRAHLLMLLHERPARVLAVGAAASGALPALLAHPVTGITLVEDDSALLDVLPAWYGPLMAAALSDRRVAAHATEPIRAVAGGGPWDLVLLLDPDPTSVRHARTRTVEFFRACAAALAPGGIVVVRVGSGDTYLGGGAGRLLATVAGSLRAVFPRVDAVPGEEVLLVAAMGEGSVSLDAAVLAGRWRDRGLVDPVFTPELLPVLLDSGRAAALNEALAAAPAIESRRARPIAMLDAVALREAKGAPSVLQAAAWWERHGRVALASAGAAVAALIVLSGSHLRWAGVTSGAAVGFVSMGWWLMLLVAWQATLGSVYAELGALSAAFMAGTVGGCALARGSDRGAARLLPVALLGGVVVSLLLALEVPLRWPRATCVPLLLLAGACTGLAFPGVARLAGGRDVAAGAGRGFAADEAGSAAGAFVVGLAALPVVGMRATALGLAAIGAAAAVAAAMAERAGRGGRNEHQRAE